MISRPVVLALLAVLPLPAATIQIGDQDYANGYIVSGSVSAFLAASAGEPAPFNDLCGYDGELPCVASWTFSFAPGSYLSATITLGIVDHDSQLPGDQLVSFDLNGIDLTAAMNAQFESYGGAQVEAIVYSLAIPGGLLPALSSGNATFTINLSNSGGPGNGIGLDFSRLDLEAVPEPGTLGLGMSGLALFMLLRRRGK